MNLVFESFAMVNLAGTIGHEAVIGRAACLNPTVNISGGVKIGAGTLVGTSAQVPQELEVDEGAAVGAAETTLVGVPAKPLAHP